MDFIRKILRIGSVDVKSNVSITRVQYPGNQCLHLLIYRWLNILKYLKLNHPRLSVINMDS